MSVRNPENFVSTLYHVGTTLGTAVREGNASATRADEIRGLIAEARRHYQAGRYEDAVDAYERARSLIYQLLHPTYRPRLDVAQIADLPVGPAVEVKLAEAGLRLAESMKPDMVSLTPPVQVADGEVPESVSRFDAIGFADVKTAADVGLTVELGIEQVARKQPDAAVETLTGALSALGDPEADRAAAGVITLNLSSAYTLQGEYDAAVEAATEASEHFAAVEDDVGRAQAQHNIAVAKDLAGETEEAEAAFTESTRLYESVAERLHGRSGGATVVAPESETATTGGTAVVPRVPDGSGRVTPITRTTSFIDRSGRLIRPDGGATMAATAPQVLEARTDLKTLEFVASRDRDTLAVRWPGESGGWSGVPVTTPAEEAGRTVDWRLGTTAGDDVVTLTWTDGKRPAATDLVERLYRPRVDAQSLSALRWYLVQPGDTSAYLLHLYSFVVPQGLGDCYHELGNFARAEECYLQAASYSYINRWFEVPSLWTRIAQNVVDWGDHLYRHEDLDACKETYAKLVTEEGTVPEDSPLFARDVFETVAGQAREVIETIRTLPETDLESEAEPGSVLDALGDVNPDLARPILVAWSRWQYLLAGLDFYGTSFTPIFTFDYLQGVARGFAERAIGAEREFVTFKSRAEAEAATRRELESAAAMAEAEVDIRWEQYNAAWDERRASEKAVDMAETRVETARDDLATYQSTGWMEFESRAYAAKLSSGHSVDRQELRRLAEKLERGEGISGEYGVLAAARTYLAGKKSYEYQLERHRNNVENMEAAVPVARAQAEAAGNREDAARLAWEAARQRESMAQDALRAFDDELFTPELWDRMSMVMRSIAESYKYSAIRAAKLMERAYNFETDSDVGVIRSEYNPGFVEGLLGADMLLRDVESFTSRLLAETRRKETRVKDVLSLANEYPIGFYEFQRTGRLAIETSLHDFDRRHPGLYGQRLDAVEVEVVGLLPPEGVTGTLQGGIVSRYRTADGGERTRIHGTDTMALSEYELRDDAYLFRQDTRVQGLFEGHGVGATWELSMPKRSNNLDYTAIVDVRLVFYYTARFSDLLEASVLSREPLPGELVGVRDFAVRADYPASWYSFLDSEASGLDGEEELDFEVLREDMPHTETNFRTAAISVRLLGTDGAPVGAGVDVTLTPPDEAAVTLATDEDGTVALETDGSGTDSLGGDVVGEWTVAIDPPEGHAIADASGDLDREALGDVHVVVEYAYDWPDATGVEIVPE